MSATSSARCLTVGLVVLALTLTACGTGDDGTTTTTTIGPTSTLPGSSTTTTPASGVSGQVVYFLLEELDSEDGSSGPFLAPVYREAPDEESDALTAVQLLLAGPSPDETAGIPSISTAIPTGTSVHGVEIVAGLATVDLSGEYDGGGGSFGMFARLAQVVYTLTRIPGVEEVAFNIDGEPVTSFSSEGIELDGPQQRDGYYDLLPPIFVDSPAWGEPLTSPIEAAGLSNVFEAVFQIMLTNDDGLPLFEDTAMASCGTGCWGEWEIDIPYTVDRDQFGALIVWELSAKDGNRVNIREYPVKLSPGTETDP